MQDWAWSGYDLVPGRNDGSLLDGHSVEVGLWDTDSTSSNDAVETISPGHDAAVSVTYTTGLVQMRSTSLDLPSGWTDFALSDNEPVERCTRSGRANVCWRIHVRENTPLFSLMYANGQLAE